jgi:hypothetical protein
MFGTGIGIGIHGHGLDTQAACGGSHPTGDLPTVGNEDFGKHGVFP